MKLKLCRYRDISLYIVFLFVLGFLFIKKADFHIDELLTYNLANAENWFEPQTGVTYTPASQPFVEAMSSNGRFDLSHVWRQQAEDTHPPFYYVLVHAICTIFPNTFSIRYAGVINIAFQLLILFFYRKIVKLFVENETIQWMISAQYVLCAGVISISSFLRMYVMAMFWVVLFAYLVLRNIGKYTLKDFVLLLLTTIGGALTHYYFIVYAFWVSVAVVIIMYIEKRIKELISYCTTMVIAGITSCLIFPSIINHLFMQGRGKESLENLGSSNLVEQIKIYCNILSHEIFGGLFWLLIATIVIVLLINFVRHDRDKEVLCKFENIEIQRYCTLIIPAFFYILVISKTAPYNVGRYISPIYGVVLSGIMCLIYKILTSLLKKEKSIKSVISALIVVVIILNFADCNWEYLYRDSEKRLDTVSDLGSVSDAICLYSSAWKINQNFFEISQCKSATFYEIKSYDDFEKENITLSNHIAFFVADMNPDDFISDFIKANPDYTIAKDNGSFGYARCIYVQKN